MPDGIVLTRKKQQSKLSKIFRVDPGKLTSLHQKKGGLVQRWFSLSIGGFLRSMLIVWGTPRLQRSTAWPAITTCMISNGILNKHLGKYRKHYITVESPGRFQHILFLGDFTRWIWWTNKKSTNMGHHFGCWYFMGSIFVLDHSCNWTNIWRSPAMYGWFQK